MSRQVKCPRCGKLTVYSTENKFRPFCSDRCQLIDLGAWADEKFAIPAEDATPPDQQDPAEYDSPADNDKYSADNNQDEN